VETLQHFAAQRGDKMAITPVQKGTAGFPGNGVYGSFPNTKRDSTSVQQTITNELIANVDNHHPNKDGLKLSIFYFNDAANTETWSSEIKNAVACAWQPDDATDDDVRVAITGATAGGSRSRGGAVFTFVAGGTRGGWLWVLHGS
jgi:hypothetical protein